MTFMSRRTARLVLLVVVSTVLLLGVTEGKKPEDPFRILGVSPSASDKEIKQKYRTLCLQYHPDKHRTKSKREQAKYEEKFKQIRKAYEEVGTAPARQRHSFQTAGYSFPSSPGSRTAPTSPEEFFRFFRTASYAQQRAPFYSFTNPQSMFNQKPSGIFDSSSLFFRQPKSVYVQKVKVPLADLYKGKTHCEFKIRTSWWRRYLASFRGGLAYWLIYQSLLYSIPLLRLSKWLSLGVGLYLFHTNLPVLPQSDTFCFTDIKPGYKGGTKLNFRDIAPGIEATFILEEESHPLFKREGNDLHVNVTLARDKLREGTVLQLEALDKSEEMIEIELSALSTVTKSIPVVGRGWPNRKTGRRGDLIVHLVLKP